jgi:hypothetical protein
MNLAVSAPHVRKLSPFFAYDEIFSKIINYSTEIAGRIVECPMLYYISIRLPFPSSFLPFTRSLVSALLQLPLCLFYFFSFPPIFYHFLCSFPSVLQYFYIFPEPTLYFLLFLPVSLFILQAECS